jgi:hypothetical protein
VSVKDHTVLAPIASLELCTDRMSDFMGPDKPSSFCNHYVELHLPASCGAFTFGRRMRSRVKTSSREQGPDFDIVGTCEWLSYVRASGSQVYDVWSGSSPAWCISIRVTTTLSVMSDSLSLLSCALGHGVTHVSSRVLAFTYRLLFRCKNSDVSNLNL